MPTKNCLTAAMLAVGQRYSTQLSFTRQQVDQYCLLSGDRNSIHSEVSAARLRFAGARDIVVPGGLIQIGITGIFGTEFPGDGCLGLSFVPERFRKPVFPGDTIGIEIEVGKIRGPIVEMDVTVRDDSGAVLSTAKSKLLAADDAYHAWWLEQC